MRAKTTALVLLTLSASPAFASCGGPGFLERLTADEMAQIDAAVARTLFNSGLVWQATKDDATITLIGTIHVDTPALPALRARVAPYVAAADLLLVEATDAEETAMMAAFANDPGMYLITEGPTLPDLLDDDLWEEVTKAAADRQIPPFMVAQFQPWYLALSLAIPPCAMADLAMGVRGLDHMIMADAQTAGVPIAPLEPWHTLIDLLQDGTQEEQIAQLQIALPPLDLQEAIFATMLDGYASGATALMWEASRMAVSHIPGVDAATAAALFAETEEGLLNDRNRAWIPVITAAVADNPALVVAAGAAHLPGDMGVLNLLQLEGWTITQLP